MSISSTSINSTFSATDTKTVGSTSTSAVTQGRDVYAFTTGNGSLQASGVIDPNITIASNSTTVSLGTLTTTGGNAFAFTGIKGLRLYNAATNGNITVTSNISGFPVVTLLPDMAVVMMTSNASGMAITGNNTITANGVTGNVLVCTMLVS